MNEHEQSKAFVLGFDGFDLYYDSEKGEIVSLVAETKSTTENRHQK